MLIPFVSGFLVGIGVCLLVEAVLGKVFDN